MRSTIFLALLASCTDPTPPQALPLCASFPVAQDIVCSGSGDACSWRGQACALDECGLPPAYPGYSASPQGDTVVIKTTQWNELTQWITDSRAFTTCETTKAQ